MNIKRDTRRDAWDRDYMPVDYIKPEPKSKKQISNATPVFITQGGIYIIYKREVSMIKSGRKLRF